MQIYSPILFFKLAFNADCTITGITWLFTFILKWRKIHTHSDNTLEGATLDVTQLTVCDSHVTAPPKQNHMWDMFTMNPFEVGLLHCGNAWF